MSRPVNPSTRCTPRAHDGGFSLVEMLVGVAIVGGIAVIGARFSSNVMNSQQHAGLSGDRTAIQDAILGSVGCAQTLATNAINVATCDPAVPIELDDPSGNPIVRNSGTPTVAGQWTLRARCVNAAAGIQAGIHVEVARPNIANIAALTDTTPGDFRMDPATGTVLDWSGLNNPRMSLFPLGAALCRAYFLAPQCPFGSASVGGLSLPANELNWFQSITPKPNISGSLLSVGGTGQKVCRYYAPLVHKDGGSDPSVFDALAGAYPGQGPGTWQIVNNGGSPGRMDHYSNDVMCPSGWRALGGGGDCSAMTHPGGGGLNSGGFTTSASTYQDGTNTGHWNQLCAGFYQALPLTPNVEARAGSIWADCQEP